MEINLMAGFDVARKLPVGQGVSTACVHGFVIRMISDHNDDDTFTLALTALFAPPERATMTWRAIPQGAALAIITTAIVFSESHFGDSELDDGDRELVAEIESFLNNGS